MEIINIGILAHVDAGKTTLTERILYETGVITTAGSVDKGTTQTDTMELERSRGISITSAVASFQLGQLKVNLIDTPGHTDFVAEVERSLGVLDAVVLVISAVEGVQSQTRRLARAIRAAGIPIIIFVNKIDRIGARGEALLDDIREKLQLRPVALNSAIHRGNREAAVELIDRDGSAWREATADLLAEGSERVIEEFERCNGNISRDFLERELRAQIAEGSVVPVYFGSAMTGVGVHDLLDGLAQWLPPAEQTIDAPTLATVFKIRRGPNGEKLVYVRLFSGQLTVRQHVTLQRRNRYGELEEIEERITSIESFASGIVATTDSVGAGDIAVVHGLRSARIGDVIGDERAEMRARPSFAQPGLESVVRAVDRSQIIHLRSALEELAEQDPLISLRQRNEEGEVSVRLFGEVQKEVMTDTLAQQYGIDVTFGPSQTICIERPIGCGEHLEIMGENGNPFLVTLGISIEVGPHGSGVDYSIQDRGSAPPAHHRAIEEAVFATLAQGLSGWEVTDCIVRVNQASSVLYSSPFSTAGDFRKLAPLVLMQALAQARTEVCEPIDRLELEIPEDTFGAVCGALIKARGTVGDTRLSGTIYHITSEIPTTELAGIEQQLPRLTRGEGAWDSTLSHYALVTTDPPPSRPRTGPNPLSRTEYLMEVK